MELKIFNNNIDNFINCDYLQINTIEIHQTYSMDDQTFNFLLNNLYKFIKFN